MTYERYREIVVARVAEATGWDGVQVDNTVGEVNDMIDDGLTPEECAREILYVICEDGEE